MDDQTRNALRAVFGFGADGGFLSAPPGLDGNPGLGLPAISGAARARGEWDVAASAHAPELPGDELTFVALADGTLVVDEDIPDGAATPLAEAVEAYLAPPYRAAALRNEGDVWGVAAAEVTVIELPSIDGNAVEVSRVGEEVSCKVDGVEAVVSPELRQMVDGLDGDVAVTAERIDGSTWIAAVWHL